MSEEDNDAGDDEAEGGKQKVTMVMKMKKMRENYTKKSSEKIIKEGLEERGRGE